jgi:hypothetical protein
MKEKLSMNDELTSVVRLFEITDRCAKAEEGRLFVHNLPEVPLPKSKPKESSRRSPSRSTAVETTLSATRADNAVTASSTSVTPTIPMIVGLYGCFMRRME